MRQHNLLSGDVDIKELAVETKNYSGAELEGLVRAAQSTAMNRHIKVRIPVLLLLLSFSKPESAASDYYTPVNSPQLRQTLTTQVFLSCAQMRCVKCSSPTDSPSSRY